jgi:hypothetical protein
VEELTMPSSNPNRGPFATEGQYQGKPSLTLKWRADSEYPFSFGLTKAQLILASIDEIKAFVERHPNESTGNRGRGRPAAQRPATATMSDADKVLEPARAAGLLPPADDDKPPC